MIKNGYQGVTQGTAILPILTWLLTEQGNASGKFQSLCITRVATLTGTHTRNLHPEAAVRCC